MALRTPVTGEKTFYLKQGDFDETMQNDLVPCEQKDAEAYIRIRQGSTGDNEIRGQMTAPRKWIVNPRERTVHETSEVNPLALGKLEMGLVILDTDIQHQDGSELKFEGTGLQRRADKADFDKWWDGLPPRWARSLYACLMEVNPDWGLKSN
jgi:hypothetical protein